VQLPPELTGTVDAHRRLRGPYTAAGTIARAVVSPTLLSAPALVQDHDVEILTVAPELRATVPATRETLTSLAVPEERTRFYSRMRTLRIAHGLAEFLCALPVSAPRSIVVENVDHADPTDIEFLAVLLRRADPESLRIVVCGQFSAPPTVPLAEALADGAEMIEAAPSPAAVQNGPGRSGADFVRSDGVSDDPALIAAYQALPSTERARLHDRRAEELLAGQQLSYTLGAIPYHRENGTDPTITGAAALRSALDYCINMGFYDATVDLGIRGRAIVDWQRQQDDWWAFTTKMTTSLAALGRPAEAEALYDEARGVTDSPSVHMQAAYATAMLHTRHYEPAQRDHVRAMGRINEAIAFASMNPDPRERAIQLVFNRNGLALVQVHLGNLPAALDIVDQGLALLDQELADDEFKLHRSVLRFNRGQVYAGLGRLDEAIADYTAVIGDDPNYPEYYFDRGNLLRRVGRNAEALGDYDTAIALSPPFPEVFYNRADLKYAVGDLTGALADFTYVLELDPRFLDAYINRASLLIELDQLDDARADVAAGLAVDPDAAYLHCILGQLDEAAGDPAAARGAYDTALSIDPDLQAAWAGRASLRFDGGDLSGALADLQRALNIGESPELRANRATVLQAANRWSEALADLERALQSEPDDTDLLNSRQRCLTQLAAS
jgi:tetratricopeptide (TPR) repeat protein